MDLWQNSSKKRFCVETAPYACQTQQYCEMMSFLNSVVFSPFSPNEQIFLCFYQVNQIVMQEIRQSTIGVTVLTPYPSHLSQDHGLGTQGGSFCGWCKLMDPDLTWCLTFTKQRQYVLVCAFNLRHVTDCPSCHENFWRLGILEKHNHITLVLNFYSSIKAKKNSAQILQIKIYIFNWFLVLHWFFQLIILK